MAATPDSASDSVIERIEAELRESRFKPWDVETFLANRHQAKIDALAQPENKWKRRRQVARELGTLVLTCVGYLTVVTLATGWLLTGEFPSYQNASPVVINPIPPVRVVTVEQPAK